ncbi:MAG TPA: hypothetical protein VN643_10640 [Pyrinomonadaceae bacterium]|nr:hypothetical protein [Pyrinomonadaceae bacterium]
MTDEEIDTSDIPPQSDAFFAQAKWRLPRLYIDRMDLLSAKKFANRILKKSWHDKNQTATRTLDHLAFNTSLIISYSRPFSRNRNFKNEPVSSLKKETGKVLNEAETELHNKILEMRDTAYAHSDASTRRLGNQHRFFLGVPNLSKPETVILEVIIGKWIEYLNKEIDNLKQRRISSTTNIRTEEMHHG